MSSEISLTLPPNLNEALSRVSKDSGISQHDLILLALAVFLADPAAALGIKEHDFSFDGEDKILH